MARDSQDRENLLRDATAFKSRVQLEVRTSERTVEVFAGFRLQGAVSLYVDQDPVYHFNNAGQLRRAFVNDKIFKAEKGQLIAWLPQRNESEVAMIRQAMTEPEQKEFCRSLENQVDDLHRAIAAGDYVLEGQVSIEEHEDVVERLADFLGRLGKIEVAASPHVGR